jgi:hypothetical protein
VADSEEARDDEVARARLRQQRLGDVEEQHQRVGVARAGGHVARVLLVARRVGDDELAPRRREVAVGDVDGDALLALGFEAVGEQREVELGRRARPSARSTAASWSS